jgi:hypothetical protein
MSASVSARTRKFSPAKVHGNLYRLGYGGDNVADAAQYSIVLQSWFGRKELNDAATQLDPLDRDGRMLDNLARNSFEFCLCG